MNKLDLLAIGILGAILLSGVIAIVGWVGVMYTPLVVAVVWAIDRVWNL